MKPLSHERAVLFVLTVVVALSSMTLVSCEKKTAPRPATPTAPATAIDAAPAQRAFEDALSKAAAELPDEPEHALPFETKPLPSSELNGGSRATYELGDAGLLVDIRGTQLHVPLGEFGPCTSDDAPDKSIRQTVRSSTWSLEGELGPMGLRFGATGAELVAFDRQRDCVRAAPFTHALTGHDPAVTEDLLLTPGPLGLDSFDDREQLEVDPDSAKRTVTIPAKPNRAEFQLELDTGGANALFADGTNMRLPALTEARGDDWTHRLIWAHDGTNDWLRLASSSETVGANDAASGTESSASINLTAVSRLPMFSRTATWSAPSREVEDGHERIRRIVPVPGGRLIIDVERSYFEGARMIGAGKCPEMEGVVDIDWERIATTWRLEPDEGRPVTLGRPSTRRLSTSACLSAVAPSFGDRPELSSPTPRDAQVDITTQTPAAPAASAD